MEQVEKTVFISYRRSNIPWALSIFKDLIQHGYDVFFDFNGIASGDFERVILENIPARAHFLVLLTPSALERCNEPADWLRREIEAALENKRNIVPLMLEGFDFGTPKIDGQLTGQLAVLKRYSALRIHPEYFDEAMERLRARYLNVPLNAVLHPLSLSAQQATNEQKAAANAAPAIQQDELTAQRWFERAVAAIDVNEQIRFYSEAIRLKPDYALAFYNRGNTRQGQGDHEGAIADYNEAIRLKPEYALFFYIRGNARQSNSDHEGAVTDYCEAIRLKPDYTDAFYHRGMSRDRKSDREGAIADYSVAIRLKPDYADAFFSRGVLMFCASDYRKAIADLSEAIRLKPDFGPAFWYRGMAWLHIDKKLAKKDYEQANRLGMNIDLKNAGIHGWFSRL